VEAAIKATALLVRKGRFRYFSSFVDEAGKIIDERAGVLRVLVETASPPEAGFEDRLKAVLKQKKNAAEVTLDIRIVPQLLAGCRISIGSEYFDGSLLGRLGRMAGDLSSGGIG
jgi:F0F1-type ATP synthase delta subunit